ncbi:MAG: HEPN domain-containing protein [Acidobacteria bacterium]|nr:HEPN domain-containing protein [Acidobacteriota bacterium]
MTRHPPDDPREWLNRARSNLERANLKGNLTYLEDLCFDAQQAAEKAIKAVLIHRKVPLVYTHNLQRLLDLVEQCGVAIPQTVAEASYLTRFASLTRYPAADEATPEQYEEAKRIAEAVLRWAEQLMLGETE